MKFEAKANALYLIAMACFFNSITGSWFPRNSSHVAIPQEDTPLRGMKPEPMGSTRRCWISVMFVVASLYGVAIVRDALSAGAAKVEPFELSQNLSQRTTFIKLPADIYNWPLNKSCRIEYLDNSSDNMCLDADQPCLHVYNCPRLVLPELDIEATVFGFVLWYGEGRHDYIPAEEVSICQGELFRDKVEYDIRKQLDPNPGELREELMPCEKEGRTYPISVEGCVVDGNHGVESCKILKRHIKVIRFSVQFFPLAEAMKNYLHLCWKRVLNAKICHATEIGSKIKSMRQF